MADTTDPVARRSTRGPTVPIPAPDSAHRRRSGIGDVARLAGVSKTAVSFAFNSPERLAPETADRILTAARDLGYRPHPVARMLTQGRTRTIGILTPQAVSVVFTNPYFGIFLGGVAGAAEEAGYSLLFVSPLQGSLARAVGRASVDGFIAVGLPAGHPEVEQIGRSGMPMILVDSHPFFAPGSVLVDDEGGARQAARHLLDLGHADVVVLAIEAALPADDVDRDGVAGRRLAGYRDALGAVGIELDERRIVYGPATIEGGAECLARVLDGGARPTGVIAMSDAMAIGAIHEAWQRGLRVPDDLSVVGFDDIDVARYVDPPLTTVRQPTREKGEEAVRLLLARLIADEVEPEQVFLPTTLVVRGSTGPAPRPDATRDRGPGTPPVAPA